MPKVSEAHVESRRAQILTAACICFARKGFHASTMQDICKTAGLSAGAIYSYFTGKDELIQALAQESVRRNKAFFDQVAGEKTVREAFRKLTGFFLQSLDAECRAGEESFDSARIKVGLWAEGVRDTGFLGELRKSYHIAIDALSDIVRRGQSSGEVPTSLDPVAVAQIYLSLLEGFTLQRALDATIDAENYVDLMEKLMERSLFHESEE